PGPPRERLRPDDLRAGDEERALHVAVADDAVDAVGEVVRVHLALAARPGALRPRREACAHVRLAPAARPELAARRARRGSDLDHVAGARVPGKRREVGEVIGERVVLVPDEPAAVEAPVR